MKSVSVIVPIYNVESYLPECLDSLIRCAGHFQEDEIEVILINDGSTDSSEDIARRYCESNNLFSLVNQVNSGLSAARNRGLAMAGGKYTFFLDSDDMLNDTALRMLYDFSESNKCEICQCGMLYYFGDNRDYVSSDTCGFRRNKAIPGAKALGLLIENKKIKNFACGKLYLTEMIRDIEFPIGKYYEDMFWQHVAIDRCQSFGIINQALYIYRQRTDSITGQFSERKLDLLEGFVDRVRYMHRHKPGLFPSAVYHFWKARIAFDNELHDRRPSLTPGNRSRWHDIEKYCDETSCQVLKSNFEYRLYYSSRTGHGLFMKAQNIIPALKRLFFSGQK